MKSGSKTTLSKLPSKVNRKPSRVQEDGSGDSEVDLPVSYHSASLFHDQGFIDMNVQYRLSDIMTVYINILKS
jgi:hypothetical protein